MKKIMIAAAIVCAAAVSQAASVYWTCKDVEVSTGVAAGGAAYFVNAAVLAQADMLDLAGEGATAVSAALNGSYAFSGADGDYGVGKTDSVENSVLGLGNGKDYKVYLVLFDTATISDSSNFYVTEVKDLSTLEGADDKASVKWGSQEAVGNWNAVSAATPEPTSGLLLLLGMAGLALKRKRA